MSAALDRWCVGGRRPDWRDLCASGVPPAALPMDPRERHSGYGQGLGSTDIRDMHHGPWVTGVAHRCWTPPTCSSGDRAVDLRRIAEDMAGNGVAFDRVFVHSPTRGVRAWETWGEP